MLAGQIVQIRNSDPHHSNASTFPHIPSKGALDSTSDKIVFKNLK